MKGRLGGYPRVRRRMSGLGEESGMHVGRDGLDFRRRYRREGGGLALLPDGGLDHLIDRRALHLNQLKDPKIKLKSAVRGRNTGESTRGKLVIENEKQGGGGFLRRTSTLSKKGNRRQGI